MPLDTGSRSPEDVHPHAEEERAKLVALVRALRTLTTRVSQLLSRRDMLPEITEQMLRPPFESLEIEFKQMPDGRLPGPVADGPRRFDRDGAWGPVARR